MIDKVIRGSKVAAKREHQEDRVLTNLNEIGGGQLLESALASEKAHDQVLARLLTSLQQALSSRDEGFQACLIIRRLVQNLQK